MLRDYWKGRACKTGFGLEITCLALIAGQTKLMCFALRGLGSINERATVCDSGRKSRDGQDFTILRKP